MTITLPAINIDLLVPLERPELKKDKICLFLDQRRLLISRNRVSEMRGVYYIRKLVYEEDVIAATYTTFRANRHKLEPIKSIDDTEALAVCLAKAAYVYYPSGQYYVVSFPFTLKRAFAFESGLVLEREQDSTSRFPNSNQYNTSRFFTLVDPIGDFRVVTTSSTSVLTSHESLLYFPSSGINKTRSLCATFDQKKRLVVCVPHQGVIETRCCGRIQCQKTEKSCFVHSYPLEEVRR